VLVDMRRPSRTIALRDPALPGYADGRFSPDGSHLITVGGPVALVWNTSDGTIAKRLRSYVGAVTAAAYSPDGKRIATGSDDGTIAIRDAQPPFDRLESVSASGAPSRLEFSADGRILMVPKSGGPAILYTCHTCEPLETLEDDARRAVTRRLTRAETARFVDEKRAPGK
jgi:WD40 repeat protein